MTLPSSGPLSLNDIQGEFGGSNPIGMNEYYAGGGLVPAGTSGTYGAVPSSGALSVQNFYGTSNYIPVYIEDLFSTWLYTGNDSAQSVPNGINLTGNGGLVWAKARDASYPHNLFDTARSSGSVEPLLSTNTTNGQNNSYDAASFGSSGFSYTYGNALNVSGVNYVSWTFRKQPKFFDIVTWTGNNPGVPGSRAISHNLGSTPGCIMIKRTNGASSWIVYHRSLPSGNVLILNSTAPQTSDATAISDVNSSTFSVGYGTNIDGNTYVAYIYAHDAGGFGATGTDNIITCGSYTSISGGAPVVTLGYEPQFLMIKAASRDEGDYGNWGMWDNMRGMTVRAGGPTANGLDPLLDANRATQEGTTYTETGDYISPTATGFIVDPGRNGWSIVNSGSGGSGNVYIYIAIRRGPMKVPTDATTVFIPVATTAPATPTTITTNFPVDLMINSFRSTGTNTRFVADRLRGSPSNYYRFLQTDSTAAEIYGNGFGWGMDSNVSLIDNGATTGSGSPLIYYNFRRAPEFFDEVCYTGNGSGTNLISHNLKTQPLLVIIKSREGGGVGWNWPAITNSAVSSQATLFLNSSTGNGGGSSAGMFTGTTVDVGTSTGLGSLYGVQQVNASGYNFVMYLFASATGVSKVGSYTGTGALQTINCNFTAGVRFVMIKRSNFSGDWYVWDSARGITAGSDPYLSLNTTNAEVTGTDYINTTSVGFQVTASAPADINGAGEKFIFLAIA